MVDGAELTQTSKSVQIILKVPEHFLKRFDKTIAELGYSRTEAIREAMRRFQAEGEKKIGERPEVAAETIAKAYAEQYKNIFEQMFKAKAESQSIKKIVMNPSKPENPQK